MLPQLNIVSKAPGTGPIRGEEEVEKDLILMVAVSDNLDRFCTGVLTETPGAHPSPTRPPVRIS